MSETSKIEEMENLARDRLSGEPTGHDFWHAVRTRNNALHIQALEGGDTRIIVPASLLHDIGDRKVLGTEDDDHSIVRDFLAEIGLDESSINHILHIIENMSYSKSIDNPDIDKTLEFQIVQDADRLDALGAIGIARAFAYGGRAGRLIHDPEASAQEFTSTAAYKASIGSTLAHFDEKLLRLKGTFNTATAREIAQSRDTYMHEFYNRFLEEWEGSR